MITREKRLFLYMLPLVLLGFAFAAYLTVLHVKVFTQFDYQANSSVCSISSKANCETVAENPYSVFLFMPVSVWGLLGYLFTAIGVAAGLVAEKRRLPLVYLFLFEGLSSCISIVLGYISITRISSICIFCFGTYILNFTLFGLASWGMWKDRIHPVRGAIELVVWFFRHPLHLGALAATGIGLLAAGYLWFPRYWQMDSRIDVPSLPKGVTADGHYWIGSEKPLVVIQEFSDFECPSCAKYHVKVRDVVVKHADTVRLVHFNYPLDQSCNKALPEPFHLAACERARMAHCAGKQGKFWEANDLLYANRGTRFSPYRLASALGIDAAALEACAHSPETDEFIRRDVEQGNRLQLNETPVFFIDGARMPSLGHIEKIIEQRTRLDSGMDGDGHPWIGAANPDLTIHEYSDYQCPHCRREHMKIRKIVAQNPRRIRLVHHHFPLDQACNRIVTRPFHTRACMLSRMAICASRQNAFWAANDILFQKENHGISPEQLAAKLGIDAGALSACTADAATDTQLRSEIEIGLLLKIDATPVYRIDDQEIPLEKLTSVIESRLAAPRPATP